MIPMGIELEMRSFEVLLAERVREEISKNAINLESLGDFDVTANFGVTSLPDTENSSADTLLISPDKALYEAKHSGRNRVCSS